jgi:hypothetical protein
VIGADPERIVDEALWALDHPPRLNEPPPLWDGRASERIVKILADLSERRQERLWCAK